MISNINSYNMPKSYQNMEQKERVEANNKEAAKNSGDSKVEAIRAQIENGTYKIDLDALAEKMADELT